MQTVYIRSGISHLIFSGNILYKAQTGQHSPPKLIKPLNRLTKKGYVVTILLTGH